MAERVLVCGGRDFNDRDLLDSVMRQVSPSLIIEGGARGADYLASEWGYLNKVARKRFPADWDQYGKAAGAIRNQQMLDEGKPDLVVAFPGGRGTADMIRRAKKAGIPVREITRLAGGVE